MIWLTFRDPDPQVTPLDKGGSEASTNLQDMARNARFSSRAGLRAKSAEQRKEFDRLQGNNLLVCSPVWSSPIYHPKDCSVPRQTTAKSAGHWMAVLVVFTLLLSIDKGIRRLFYAL